MVISGANNEILKWIAGFQLQGHSEGSKEIATPTVHFSKHQIYP